jgi:hypothetical protein
MGIPGLAKPAEKRKVGGSTPPLTTSQLAACEPVARPNASRYWFCSALPLPVAARSRPSFAVRWGTQGARRMILSMRATSARVVQGRSGNSVSRIDLALKAAGQAAACERRVPLPPLPPAAGLPLVLLAPSPVIASMFRAWPKRAVWRARRECP